MKTSKRLFRTWVLCITILVSLLMLGTALYETFNVSDKSSSRGIKFLVFFLGGVALPIIIVTVLPGEDE
ncbi:hypothetical protein Pan161_40870 [Gimesia algae]|uniref:Uncharacterized protein n=1 Tax=Gimesia algae TaxID=2527971 RepID=A0A517VHD7_9PLAN|nr:hypothetical protein Pan161_40870 [Gimesia algae]